MRRNDSSAGTGAGNFRTTCWSAVLLSAQSEALGSGVAREELCRSYWYPLYAFVRRRGYDAEDAKDLTQGFFLSLLNRRSLDQVTPIKGKFRSFLLASLKHYLSAEFHRESTIKRGGNLEFVSLDFDSCDDRFSNEPPDILTPEKVFDARWAMTLLGIAMDRLQAESESRGKITIFNVLKPFLDFGNSESLPAYETVAEKLGVGKGAVKTLIHRLRKRHGQILREEVSRTVTDPDDVDDEIRALCDAVAAAEGLIGST
ncbi:MAG: sigma-70 family RNA polymerase sigma factor [Verrucomicrobia bacterium]|nr:sigma-70 family RNA polymerase sigma factor [Verrucomicrobiota bacterium]